MVEQSLDAALNSIINVISGCVITLLITMYRQKKKQNDALKAGLQALLRDRMLMYGKEASNRKQEIDRQHYTIPNQRPKDKHCGKI